MKDRVILIVEDDAKSLKLVRDLLTTHGYTIIEATDGRSAIEMAKTRRPELILMDIQLPIMNGLEATKMLKADSNTKNITIIAMTAYAMKEDEERVREAGCDDYITKPVNVRHFLAKVEEIMNKPAKSQE